MFQFPKSSIPNWVIALMDVLTCLISLVLAFFIRFDLSLENVVLKTEFDLVKYYIPIYILIKTLILHVFKIQRSLIRHTSLEDLIVIFKASFASTCCFIILTMIRYTFVDGYYMMPLSILMMEFFISSFLMIVVRLGIKFIYVESRKSNVIHENTLIYGAGTAGRITLKSIDSDRTVSYNVVGFVDDSRAYNKSTIYGVKVYHTSGIEYVIKKYKVSKLIIAIASPKENLLSKVVDTCLKYSVEVHKIPSPKSWINGELNSSKISKYNIEDLLGRESIVLDPEAVQKEYNQQVILVTGAAGSIGSGLVRQLALYHPSRVILLDQAESPIYDLQNELKQEFSHFSFETVIADVCHYQRLEEILRCIKPDIIFHAAAYKHVPLMEENPYESIVTNIHGTKNMVDLAIQFEVKKFVMISTDKAVNPTNVMGASKRIAEIYAQTIEAKKTKFITTRFGNVLGSNGSVIPLFKRQLEHGGPLTITDAEVTRYFMTIPEACSLVLEAGCMGDGSEIFVFDMGKPVKIIDLAQKMIMLSGLKNIDIEVTGLRPGEKLYEELLAKEEGTLTTHHPKILRANTRKENQAILQQISELIEATKNEDNFELVGRMKSIVPEFISNNSIYSKLDNEHRDQTL